MDYSLVYDATKDEFPWGVLVQLVAMLSVGVVFLTMTVRQKRHKAQRFMIFWLVAVVLLGGVGSGNVIYQYMQCKEWLNSNNYKVVEGVVAHFHPMPKSGHDTERFTVSGINFEYSDFDLSKGGFNTTSSHGGPIKEGIPVRIAYKDGRILKLEVASVNDTKQGTSLDANSAAQRLRQ